MVETPAHIKDARMYFGNKLFCQLDKPGYEVHGKILECESKDREAFKMKLEKHDQLNGYDEWSNEGQFLRSTADAYVEG